MMTESERKIMQANIKLQDENNDLKFTLNRMRELIEKIKTYIQINKSEDGKINANSIFEMIGDYYE